MPTPLPSSSRRWPQQPDDTKVLFALGNTASQLGLAGPAEQFFRRVLALDPCRKEAIVNLANLLRGAGQHRRRHRPAGPGGGARARKPRTAPDPGLGLAGKRRFRTGRPRITRRPWWPIPAMPRPWPIWPICWRDAGDRAAARTLYDKAIKADPGNAPGPAEPRDSASSERRSERWLARLCRPRRCAGQGAGVTGEQRLAAWTGDSLKKKRLLVRAEQGVGDQIMFAGLIPDLAARAKAEGGSVMLECEPRLVPLFARSFPGRDGAARRDQDHRRHRRPPIMAG